MYSAEDPLLKPILEHVSHHGLASASLAKLAEATGLSKSGLYARFGSRSTLLQYIAEGVTHRFIHSVWLAHAEEEPGATRLRGVIADWIKWVQGEVLSGGCPISLLLAEMGPADEAARQILVDGQRKWQVILAREFAAANERLRVTNQDDQAAFELYCLMTGYGAYCKDLSEPSSPQKLQTAIDRLLGAST